MRITALLALLLLLAGCSASHVFDDPSDYLEALAAAECERAIRCEPSLGLAAPLAQQTCHPATDAIARLEGAPALVARGDLRYDPERAEACIAELRELPCRTPSLGLFAASCFTAIEPTLALGDACDPVGVDACAGDTFCAATDACTGTCSPRGDPGESCAVRPCVLATACGDSGEGAACLPIARGVGEACTLGERCAAPDGEAAACVDGVCALLPRVAVGGACGAEGACVDGARCIEALCVADGQLGEPCADRRCASGLRCAPGADGSVCVAASEAGGPCTASSECAESAPYCDLRAGTTGTCSADPTGAPCRSLAYGLAITSMDTCPATHRCDVRSRCAPIVPLGASCEEAACDAGARCVSGRCVAIVGPGAACGDDAVCPFGLECRDGACAPLPLVGETCETACANGTCAEGVCTSAIDHADAGEPCGFGVGICAPELACLRRADDRGTCAAACVAP